MNDAFLEWWKETGQFECAMTDYGSPDEYKRILWAAWRSGMAYQKLIRREPQSHEGSK